MTHDLDGVLQLFAVLQAHEDEGILDVQTFQRTPNPRQNAEDPIECAVL